MDRQVMYMLCHIARRESGKRHEKNGRQAGVPERVTRPQKVIVLTFRRHMALIKYRVQNRHAV